MLPSDVLKHRKYETWAGGLGKEKRMGKILTDKEMVQRLIEAGWTKANAEKELEKMLADAAEEDGME